MDSVLNQLIPIFERDWPSKYEDWIWAEKEFNKKNIKLEEFASGTKMEDHQDPGQYYTPLLFLRILTLCQRWRFSWHSKYTYTLFFRLLSTTSVVFIFTSPHLGNEFLSRDGQMLLF